MHPLLFAALVAAWGVAKNPVRALVRPAAALAAGLACGAVMSAAAGGLAGSADRVHDGIDGQDPGGSTRFSLWQGAFEVIKGHPFTGAGPDGLYLGFPVGPALRRQTRSGWHARPSPSAAASPGAIWARLFWNLPWPFRAWRREKRMLQASCCLIYGKK